MKRILTLIITAVILCTVVTGCSDSSSSTSASENSSVDNPQSEQSESSQQNISSSNDENSDITQNVPTEEPTQAIFDVTKAYKNKPYTDDFAISRVSELQYIDDNSLCYLSSSEPSPIFYEGFFYENNTFNVNMEKYGYDLDNETVRKYFDTYEYNKFASAGALRIIDSFVYNDIDNNRMLYYCYYTVTHWSENEELDTMDYYRDLITVNKKDNSIKVQEKIAIKTGLGIPKEISGEHDFHNVI